MIILLTEEDLIKRLNEWKNNVQNRGMRVNMNKTKVTISGERQKPLQKAARWPCGVCGRGVGSNSKCICCHKWVHKDCSGIKGSMYKVMRSFICRGCSNPVQSNLVILPLNISPNLLLANSCRGTDFPAFHLPH